MPFYLYFIYSQIVHGQSRGTLLTRLSTTKTTTKDNDKCLFSTLTCTLAQRITPRVGNISGFPYYYANIIYNKEDVDLPLTRIACMYWFVYSNMLLVRTYITFLLQFHHRSKQLLEDHATVLHMVYFFKLTVLDGLLITNPTMCRAC